MSEIKEARDAVDIAFSDMIEKCHKVSDIIAAGLGTRDEANKRGEYHRYKNLRVSKNGLKHYALWFEKYKVSVLRHLDTAVALLDGVPLGDEPWL